MVNLVGAYIVAIFILALVSQRVSVRSIESALRAKSSLLLLTLYCLLALVGLDALELLPHSNTVMSILGWVTFAIQGLNLWIHEAGHAYLAWAGEVLHVAGGTILQLLFPSLFLFFSFRCSARFCSILAIYWLGLNFAHIAPYIADARAQALPLLGGGEHDWHFLLGRWGLLARDTELANLCWWLGAICLAAFILFGLKVLRDPGDWGETQQ
ncbi:MAG: hypothetical protein K1X79_04055 [Oligoflexia bacterium]|nr:hypothetical protein [Oligoflexia bacterium]